MNRFALAYREQQQLFLFDKTYLLGTILKVGGLSTLTGRFIVQFFWNPTIALCLTVLLLLLGGWMLWASVRRSFSDWVLLPVVCIPFVLLGASLADNAVYFDVVPAWLFAVGALWLYNNCTRARVWKGLLLTGVLYLAAGPAALLFAVCAMITDAFRRDWRGTLYPVLGLLCGWLAYRLAWVPTLAAAWTPALYYNIDAPLPAWHWTAWACLPLSVLFCEVLKRLKVKRWVPLVAGLALLGGTFIPAGSIAKKSELRQSSLDYEFEYYTCREDWDGLIEACMHAPWLPRTANYLNMAFAWKGELSERLFTFDQRGPSALVQNTPDRGIDVAMSHLLFTMGNIAAAQDVAFNLFYSLNGMCPAMVKINAQIELMRGTYAVADKYLSILEKAPHYRSWARSHRRFLYDDAAVEADPLLGNGRRNLAAENGFSMFSDPVGELFPILDVNPGDTRAREYVLCYLLLMKDLNSVKHFIEDYYQGEKVLPRVAQEAMVFYSEYSRNVEGIEPFGIDWCYDHGVIHDTVLRFIAYQQAAVAGKASLQKFRGTYWYYLIHTEI